MVVLCYAIGEKDITILYNKIDVYGWDYRVHLETINNTPFTQAMLKNTGAEELNISTEMGKLKNKLNSWVSSKIDAKYGKNGTEFQKHLDVMRELDNACRSFIAGREGKEMFVGHNESYMNTIAVPRAKAAIESYKNIMGKK